MTNEQEHFLVMSESELKELLNATVESVLVAYDIISGTYATLERQEKAEAACRARKVLPAPEHEGIISWVEVKNS